MANVGYRIEDTRFQFGKEVTWGGSVSPTLELKYTSLKAGQFHEDIKFPGSASRGALIAERAAGVLDEKITLQLALDEAVLADILEMAFGTRTTLTGGTIQITMGNALPSYTCYYNEGVGVKSIVGVKCNTLEIKGDMNAAITATLELDGKTGAAATLGAISANTTASAWVFHQGIFSFGATSLNIKSWSVKISNNLAVDHANSQRAIEILETRREVSGSVEVKLEASMDATIMTAKLTQASAAVAIYATNASSKYFKLALTNVRPEGEPPEFTKKDGELTYVTFNFKAYLTDAATGELSALVTV